MNITKKDVRILNIVGNGDNEILAFVEYNSLLLLDSKLIREKYHFVLRLLGEYIGGGDGVVYLDPIGSDVTRFKFDCTQSFKVIDRYREVVEQYTEVQDLNEFFMEVAALVEYSY